MEFNPESKVIRFHSSPVQFDSLQLQDGLLTGYHDDNLLLRASGGSDLRLKIVKDDLSTDNEPELRITPEEVLLQNVDEFLLVHPKTGEIFFDMNSPDLTLSGPIEHLEAEEVLVDKIVSPLGHDILLRSDATLNLLGTEGVLVEGKNIVLDAEDDIDITTEQDIILDGDIHIDPRALPLGGGSYPSEESQFKLCICVPSGLLFRVPVPTLPKDAEGPLPKVSCREAENWQYHPCSVTMEGN